MNNSASRRSPLSILAGVLMLTVACYGLLNLGYGVINLIQIFSHSFLTWQGILQQALSLLIGGATLLVDVAFAILLLVGNKSFFLSLCPMASCLIVLIQSGRVLISALTGPSGIDFFKSFITNSLRSMLSVVAMALLSVIMLSYCVPSTKRALARSRVLFPLPAALLALNALLGMPSLISYASIILDLPGNMLRLYLPNLILTILSVFASFCYAAGVLLVMLWLRSSETQAFENTIPETDLIQDIDNSEKI